MKIRVGGNTNFSVFRYQHVGITNAKFGGFASHWNIRSQLTGGGGGGGGVSFLRDKSYKFLILSVRAEIIDKKDITKTTFKPHTHIERMPSYTPGWGSFSD